MIGCYIQALMMLREKAWSIQIRQGINTIEAINAKSYNPFPCEAFQHNRFIIHTSMTTQIEMHALIYFNFSLKRGYS